MSIYTVLVLFLNCHNLQFVSLCNSSDIIIKYYEKDKFNINNLDSSTTSMYLIRVKTYNTYNEIVLNYYNMPYHLSKIHDNACVVFRYHNAKGSLCYERPLYQLKLQRRINGKVKPAKKDVPKVIIKDATGTVVNGIMTYDEGESIEYTCSLSFYKQNYFLMWKVYQNKEVYKNPIIHFSGNVGYSLNLKMVMNDLDNFTAIQCYAYKESFQIASSGFLHFKIRQKPFFTYTYDRSLVSPEVDEITYYQKGNTFTCGNVPTSVEKVWLTIEDGILISKNMTMSPTEDTEILFCVTYLSHLDVTTQTERVERKISRIEFRSTEDLDYYESHLIHYNTKYYIFIACGVGVFVLLIGAFCVWRRKREPAHEVETYDTPRVQYVDLEFSSRNTCTKIKEEDSPYAEIVGVLQPNKKYKRTTN